MCWGLFAPLSRISRVPWNVPGLTGANSTEIVQVASGASVAQVLAVTLYGGVAAGAIVSVMGTGLGLLSVTIWVGPAVPDSERERTRPKSSDFGCILSAGATALPLSLTGRCPLDALLLTRIGPCWVPS